MSSYPKITSYGSLQFAQPPEVDSSSSAERIQTGTQATHAKETQLSQTTSFHNEINPGAKNRQSVETDSSENILLNYIMSKNKELGTLSLAPTQQQRHNHETPHIYTKKVARKLPDITQKQEPQQTHKHPPTFYKRLEIPTFEQQSYLSSTSSENSRLQQETNQPQKKQKRTQNVSISTTNASKLETESARQFQLNNQWLHTNYLLECKKCHKLNTKTFYTTITSFCSATNKLLHCPKTSHELKIQYVGLDFLKTHIGARMWNKNYIRKNKTNEHTIFKFIPYKNSALQEAVATKYINLKTKLFQSLINIYTTEYKLLKHIASVVDHRRHKFREFPTYIFILEIKAMTGDIVQVLPRTVFSSITALVKRYIDTHIKLSQHLLWWDCKPKNTVYSYEKIKKKFDLKLIDADLAFMIFVQTEDKAVREDISGLQLMFLLCNTNALSQTVSKNFVQFTQQLLQQISEKILSKRQISGSSIDRTKPEIQIIEYFVKTYIRIFSSLPATVQRIDPINVLQNYIGSNSEIRYHKIQDLFKGFMSNPFCKRYVTALIHPFENVRVLTEAMLSHTIETNSKELKLVYCLILVFCLTEEQKDKLRIASTTAR